MKTSLKSRRAVVARLLSVAALVGIAGTCSAPAWAEPRDVHPARHHHHHRPGQAVVHWNAVASEAFTPSQGTNPMMQSRTLAIMHAAIHDALNAIDRRYQSYTPGLQAAPRASPDAAVAAAAREVLVNLLPDQAAMVETAYGRALMAVRDGQSKTAGITTGQAAAWATMNRRQGDGADTAAQPVYEPGHAPGEYQFTAPFNFAAQPGWGRVKPFVIDLHQHATEGPLPLTSVQYAQDLAHIREIGHEASTTRTPEQSEVAKFWYEDSPLGWTRIANAVARQRGLDDWAAARAFALMHFAMADGFIAGFHAKYQHRFWRPVTAIHLAATDGNPLTHADASWQPFLVTPPVPDYPSTHTVLGWAAAEVLIDVFGDKVRYSATSLTLPGVTRHYRGFSQAAQENGLSRLYAGIHFRHAVKDGRRQGRSVGQAVAEALAPVR
ncbi:MAG: vanadium-dependent haloperoxidase [Aquabacterium sp.]|uniref:vanadium-dependent haloperoxidase n=1 Tax=Aquabacterium sp. TaxID=1872578 RepID=UPI002717E1F5|nr:vanadium-dependent haloperoxidase [Aquabacterium sp.]MDO9002411.1 vanadium-dependent haloperoxidase [Aquabacterium sp.]